MSHNICIELSSPQKLNSVSSKKKCHSECLLGQHFASTILNRNQRKTEKVHHRLTIGSVARLQAVNDTRDKGSTSPITPTCWCALMPCPAFYKLNIETLSSVQWA